MQPTNEPFITNSARATLCLGKPAQGEALQQGDHAFAQTLQLHYSSAESEALDRLTMLKRKLKHIPGPDFWEVLIRGMTDLTGAQYGFVSKRLENLADSDVAGNSLFGEAEDCLLAVVLYWNDGGQLKNLARDYKYRASGSPCGGMRHNKVYLVPDSLPQLFPNNPNQLPFPAEAYIGLPLVSEEQCFGHFGLMWNLEGLQRRFLSWAVVELLLHSLEDTILHRFERLDREEQAMEDASTNQGIMPALEASQSLKPFAQNLSHELRTPMQGVVGMLDVMHATVQESLQGHTDPRIKDVLDTLRGNIEVVQDSSRRAVEAADNVVYAYDLNMQVPDTPLAQAENNVLPSRFSTEHQSNPPHPDIHASHELEQTRKRKFDDLVERSPHIQSIPDSQPLPSNVLLKIEAVRENVDEGDHDPIITPGPQLTNIRDSLHFIVHESLYMGGRPESAIAQATAGGETIKVGTRNADGSLTSKTIEWHVDEDVPDNVGIDEKSLAKLVSCVLLNAIKFTEHGEISLRAFLSSRNRIMVIRVTDTGTGIPRDFLPFLFKPFSREDNSLTRSKEGLGLGLLVARGIARKIGGDLVCTRSATSGPERGSDFELRIPLGLVESSSRVPTPHRTPTPEPAPGHKIVTESNFLLIEEKKNSVVESLSEKEALDLTTLTSTPRSSSVSHSRKSSLRRPSIRQSLSFDSCLATSHPHTFLVVEDNPLNRKLLVGMLGKLGYHDVYEAFDGAEAVIQMTIDREAAGRNSIDMILMDLWMPVVDGYSASEQILAMQNSAETRDNNGDVLRKSPNITIIAVTADVTDSALDKAKKAGIAGVLAKPYTLLDLERKIVDHCTTESRFGFI